MISDTYRKIGQIENALRYRTRRQFEKWFRKEWPSNQITSDGNKKATIVFVNYNTFELTSHLLFSLFRILGRDQIERIVAVDNGSSDNSQELLGEFIKTGMVDVILNKKQCYHGSALNMAMNYLVGLKNSRADSVNYEYIWILDSDAVVLRREAFIDSVKFLENEQAAVVGQFQFDVLTDGYAHISCMLIKPEKVWKRSIYPFDNSGSPAKALHISLRKRCQKIANFPFRSQQYVLHLGRGTLESLVKAKEKKNLYYDWALKQWSSDKDFRFHGDVHAEKIYNVFLKHFSSEIPNMAPAEIVKACLKPDLIDIGVPDLVC